MTSVQFRCKLTIEKTNKIVLTCEVQNFVCSSGSEVAGVWRNLNGGGNEKNVSMYKCKRASAVLHTHTHTRTHKHTLTHTPTHLQSHWHTHTHTHTHTETHTYTLTHTPTHLHTYNHTDTPTHPHTHPHTHTHTPPTCHPLWAWSPACCCRPPPPWPWPWSSCRGSCWSRGGHAARRARTASAGSLGSPWRPVFKDYFSRHPETHAIEKFFQNKWPALNLNLHLSQGGFLKIFFRWHSDLCWHENWFPRRCQL